MRLILSLFLSSLISVCLNAQHTLQGIVLDAVNGEPLSSVNVFLKNNQSRGVLTNERGEYQLNILPEDQGDRLVFSLLSYKTHEEQLDGRSIFNLQMQSSFVSLGEVVVISDLGLRTLMERTFAAIPNNYGSEDYVLKAYTRNYQIDDGKYSQLLEAIVNIRDKPYGRRTKENKRIPQDARVEAFRMERDTGSSLRDRWPVMGQQWQLRGFVSGDIARIGNYTYRNSELSWTEGMTFSNRGEYLNGTDTIVRIAYAPNEKYTAIFGGEEETNEDNWWCSGEFLINKNDYAILRHTKGDRERGSLTDVTYQKINGKYYLKQQVWYIELEYENDTRQFIEHNMVYVTDVVVGKKAARKAMKGKEIRPKEDLAALKVKYDPEFWRDHQLLQTLSAPEEMRLTMNKMQQTMERLKVKRRQTNRDSMR